MENASKAILMAGGMLLGALLLALIVALFASSRDVSDSYDRIKKAEEIQQFNTNFTKYLGQDLTIHEVVTICNFANKNSVTIISGEKTREDIKNDVEDYSADQDSIKKYELEISGYSNQGYINSIRFSDK